MRRIQLEKLKVYLTDSVAFVILILCSVLKWNVLKWNMKKVISNLQSCWEAGQGLSMASLLHIGLEEVAEHVKQVSSGMELSKYVSWTQANAFEVFTGLVNLTLAHGHKVNGEQFLVHQSSGLSTSIKTVFSDASEDHGCHLLSPFINSNRCLPCFLLYFLAKYCSGQHICES